MIIELVTSFKTQAKKDNDRSGEMKNMGIASNGARGKAPRSNRASQTKPNSDLQVLCLKGGSPKLGPPRYIENIIV